MSSTAKSGGPAYSIAARLTLFFVLFFGLVTFISGAALYQLVYRHVSSELDGDIARDMGEFKRIVRHENLGALKEAFAAYEKSSGKSGSFVRLVDGRGNVLMATDMGHWHGMPLPEQIQSAEKAPIFSTIDLPDDRLKARLLAAPAAPVGYLQMGVSLEDSERLFGHFKRFGFVILMMMLALGAPIGWWLARRALVGVEVVTQTARSVADGHFSERVDVTGYGREIDDLVYSFNLMVERVQAVMDEMRQINDNIAHDLRSPLTRIRAMAEDAALSNESHSETGELAGSIVEECDRLMLLINTMLDISEVEAGIGHLRFESVDVDEFVRQAVELFSGVAEEQGVRLVCEPMVTPVSIQADRRKLQRALTNLIDNAIKYTLRDGQVRIKATHRNGSVEIKVSDTGIGIAANDLPRIFDRFYRADESRHQSGNGLGLSLAQAIAKAHGGGISVTSKPGSGSAFILILPA